jgi:hypothetical protein
VLHHDHDLLDAGHEVHGAAHALHHLAGDHPVGEVAILRDLHRAEDRQIDVAAADHRERVGGGEIARRRQLGDRLLAGIDEVRVLLALVGKGAHAEHPVLALELHAHAGRDVVRYERRDADAEIDVEAVLQLPGGALRHLIAGPGHVVSPQAARLRTVRCSMRFSAVGGVDHALHEDARRDDGVRVELARLDEVLDLRDCDLRRRSPSSD